MSSGPIEREACVFCLRACLRARACQPGTMREGTTGEGRAVHWPETTDKRAFEPADIPIHKKQKINPKKTKKKKTAQIAAMRAGRRTRIFTVPSKWPTTVLAWQAACVPSKHHLISFECPTKPLNVFLFSFFLYPVCIQTINRLLLRRAFLRNAAA